MASRKMRKLMKKAGKVLGPVAATVAFGPAGGKIFSAYSGFKKYTSAVKQGDTRTQALRAGGADLAIGLASTYITAGIMKPGAEPDPQTGETAIQGQSMAGYIPIQAGYDSAQDGLAGPGKAGSIVKYILYILAAIAALFVLLKYQPWKHLKLATA